MSFVLSNAWALLLGVLLLMVGNGLQGTLLAVRGDFEGFSATTMSVVMSGYFVGFLIGSRVAPELIRRVGHVRVFAALASFISAVFILYAALPYPWVWVLLRIIVGFCFSGVYVVAESWLNDVATNETRGKALSAYLIVQMAGIISAQALLNVADVNGFVLFALMSVLVSISFGPILLSVSPAPAFEATKAMPLRKLWTISPLGCFGIFMLGGVFAAQFGMAGVYATQQELSIGQLSIFVGTIYVGGLIMQYPLGYISDRMDRRRLIAAVTGFGAISMVVGIPLSEHFSVLLILAFIMGGVANPLYSLLLAYTNDYLEHEDMAAASGGLIFLNGLGAISGPLVVGWLMGNVGPSSFFGFIAALLAITAVYAVYRMTQREAVSVDETGAYTAVSMQASPVTVEAVQEIASDQAIEAEAAIEEQGENDTEKTSSSKAVDNS
jgi:MFS family permease